MKGYLAMATFTCDPRPRCHITWQIRQKAVSKCRNTTMHVVDGIGWSNVNVRAWLAGSLGPVLEKPVRTSTDEELEMIRTQAEGHARGRL